MGWKVISTYHSGMQVFSAMRGYPGLFGKPLITEKVYRRRWRARLSAWFQNIANPGPSWLYGVTHARVERANPLPHPDRDAG